MADLHAVSFSVFVLYLSVFSIVPRQWFARVCRSHRVGKPNQPADKDIDLAKPPCRYLSWFATCLLPKPGGGTAFPAKPASGSNRIHRWEGEMTRNTKGSYGLRHHFKLVSRRVRNEPPVTKGSHTSDDSPFPFGKHVDTFYFPFNRSR